MKKLGLIIVALVVALGALGAGYAAWSQSLAVNANVHTGNLAATITPGTLAKSAEYSTIALDATSSSTNLIVNIGNAAPGNVFTIPWTITNTGTIPINIAAPTATVTPDAAALVNLAHAADLSVAGTANMVATNLPGAGTVSNSLTITVQDSAPNVAGGCGYSVSIPLTVNQ